MLGRVRPEDSSHHPARRMADEYVRGALFEPAVAVVRFGHREVAVRVGLQLPQPFPYWWPQAQFRSQRYRTTLPPNAEAMLRHRSASVENSACSLLQPSYPRTQDLP